MLKKQCTALPYFGNLGGEGNPEKIQLDSKFKKNKHFKNVFQLFHHLVSKFNIF